MDWEIITNFYFSEPGAKYALATLVAKQGSSYRQPGARMLIRQDGSFVGSVSAGCLEEEISKVGLEMIDQRATRLLTIDTRPFYGCYGEISVFVEPLCDASESMARFSAVRDALQERRSLKLVTRYGADDSKLPRTSVVADEADGEDAAEDCFVESMDVRPRVVIIGSWTDAGALARIARMIHWDVLQFEPGVNGCRPEDLNEQVAADEDSALVLMTHNLGKDAAFLREALRAPWGYIGAIGSRRRASELINGLEQQHDPELAAEYGRLRCPAGLDIGVNNAETIALSVVAEISALWAGRDARPLRDRAEPIHDGER